ncbi:MAG: Maf family protein [Planctomycetota bacterium]
MSDTPAPTSPTLVLASRSPRRAQLLRGAGFDPVQITPAFQDPADPNDAFAQAPEGPDAALHLAERKANSLPPAVFEQFPGAVILTSDTVGITPAGHLVGTPESREQALAMLRKLVNQPHTIATGVGLRLPDGTLESLVESAAVNLGPVEDDELERYVATDQWVGKAGGYNLIERQTAGWPITVEGDPGTVMGLPMVRLTPMLLRLGVARRSPDPAQP